MVKSVVKTAAAVANTVVAVVTTAVVSPSAASWINDSWDAFKRDVVSVVHDVRNWAANKVAQVKAKVKAAVSGAVQAGKKVVSGAVRAVSKAAGGIADAYNSGVDWVKKHENELITTGVGLAVDLICGAILSGATGGAAAVVVPTICGALSGAISSAVGKFLDCHDKTKAHAAGDCSVGSYLKTALVGAIGGAVGGLGGAIGGKLATAIVSKGLGLLARVGVGAVAGAVTGALSGGIAGAATAAAQYGLNCDDKCSWGGLGAATKSGAIQGAEAGGVAGLAGGALGGIKPPKAHPEPGAEPGAAPKKPTEREDETPEGGTCPTGPKAKVTPHSFDPNTDVLMADGSVRPIKDVNVGDKVVSTDPVSGSSLVEPVTMLHINQDTALTDVTLTLIATNPHSGPAPPADGHSSGSGGRSVTLHTTQHHPFWDDTAKLWVDAADLVPGHLLLTEGGSTAVVAGVRNFTGSEEMRDLTVATIHTYYVVPGTVPVLVHNNNGVCDVPTLKGYAKQIREAGDHPASVNQRTVAVGQDEAGNLTAGSSNGFDGGQRAMADSLGIRRVPSLADQHAEENLISDNEGSIWPLKRVGTDARIPCGPDEHDCAAQLDALGIGHE